MNHEVFIRRTIELAKNGYGFVSPNPLVGALIVQNNQIISEGYHQQFGSAHAEINALRSLSEEQKNGASLYVNLEPCSHTGKTPPCTDEIIKSKIKTVIFGMEDPNPLVAGNGLTQLSNAGIQVIGPVLNDACLELNKGYIKSILRKTPWLTMKIAQTLDGRIALKNRQSKWITCEASRKLVHQWRSEHDAILVGIETVVTDNPKLNTRLYNNSEPKRIILDSKLRISEEAYILQNSPEKTIIFTSELADENKIRFLEQRGVHIIKTQIIEGKLCLDNHWENLIKRGICSIFIEGGHQIFSYFTKHKVTDEIKIFIAPKIFGQGISSIDGLSIKQPEDAIQFNAVSWKQVDHDLLFEGKLSCLQDWLKK